MPKRRMSSRHLVAIVLLLVGVAAMASGCIVAPAGYPAYGYEPAPPAYGPVYGPPVVVAPPPVVIGGWWGWRGGWHRRW